MSANVTHIYRVDIGHPNKIIETCWVYARNAKCANEFCKAIMKGKGYDHYKAVMVGETKTPMSLPAYPAVLPLSAEEVKQISNTHAKDGAAYAEHRNSVSRI